MKWRRVGNGWWRVWLLVTLGACWSAVAAAESATAPTPITRYQLKNGLKVVLAPDRATAGVSVVVRYDVGLAHDPRGYRGLSHLLEHLTFRGSRHVAPLQGIEILQEIGAGFNATTGLEATEYYMQVAAPALDTALWLESERMAFTLDRLDEQALDVERRIVDNEHRERHGAFGGLLDRHWLRALYSDGHPFVDDPDSVRDVSSVTLRGAQWYFQTAYRPDNATLTLVGQFDLAQVQSSIEKYFGPIVSPVLPRASMRAGAPRLCGIHRLGFSHAGLFSHALRITWPLPHANSSPDRANENMLSQLLERQLHGLLVVGGVDVVNVRASVNRFLTHDLLSVDLELHDKADAAAVERVVLEAGRGLAKQLPQSRALLPTARANLISNAVFNRENGIPRALELASGGDPDADAAALRVLNEQQLLRAAQPLAGPLLVVHAFPSRSSQETSWVEEEVNPCH